MKPGFDYGILYCLLELCLWYQLLLPYLLLCICAGPDRPYISVPNTVVARMHQLVTVTCSVQATAYVDDSSDLKLNWKVVRRYTIQLT